MSYEKLTSSSPEAQSESSVADHVTALASLFPSVIREGKIDFDALRQMLGEDVAKDDELFGLQWKGKAQARRGATTPSLGTLRPCKEESVDWDTTKNLYLEGDNLEVLKLLRKSYAGKVKMIYIDPPYNTGKEFVYPDNYQNGIGEYKKLTGQLGGFKANAETSGRYHTNWLNMMYPRLFIAKDLLRDDGVFFLSIDDNEVHNLRLLMNEIFGEENFFCQIIVRSNSRGQTYKQIAKTHEYVLVYTKNNNTELFELEKDASNSDLNLSDDISSFNIRELRNRNPKFGKHNRPFLFYPIYVNPNIIDKDGFYPVSLYESAGYTVKIEPYNSFGKESCWRWGKHKTLSNINNSTLKSNLIAKKKNNGEYNIYEKYRKTTYKPKSIWDDNAFLTESGTIEVKSLGFNDEFDFPKPVKLIKQIAQLSTEDEDIVLDFFSGSATTAHAVMELNAENDGKRQYIMVQLPEPCEKKNEPSQAEYQTICDIAKERIRRAGKKIKEEAGLQGQHLDIGFRVYKLDSSNLRVWNPEADDLELALGSHEKHLLPGRTQEDLLYEILLKQGIELTEDARIRELGGKRVYSLGHGQYYACMETAISSDQIESLALGIAQWKHEESPDNTQCAVFVIDEAFRSDADKLNFAKILEQHGIPSVKAL